MPNNFVALAIYQIDGDNLYNSSFPLFKDFPIGGLFVRGITPPNATRGVLCYGAVRSWAHGNHEYYTNLTMAEIIELANLASNRLVTEDGVTLTDESGNTLTTEQ